MTGYHNPFDSAYYSSLAAHCFATLAPGITPCLVDIDQRDRLSAELQRLHNPFHGPMHFRSFEDKGLPLVEINDPFGRPVVTCWIEYLTSPRAFFYWES